ncbi:MAG: 50S ribosomal protein L9 [Alphaproteobacteria bacterium]
MQIILLERIEQLGQMGDVVSVKSGYARNFLLPSGKALRANKLNLEQFESRRVQLETHNLDQRKEAEAVAEKLEGQTFVALRQAGDSGQLFGSVTTGDIASEVSAGGFTLTRAQVVLNRPIKTLGLHDVRVKLHPEVFVSVVVNVARTQEEAERQARGEDINADPLDEDFDEENAEEISEVFDEEGAQHVAEEAEAAADEEADGDSGGGGGASAPEEAEEKQ